MTMRNPTLQPLQEVTIQSGDALLATRIVGDQVGPLFTGTVQVMHRGADTVLVVHTSDGAEVRLLLVRSE